MAHNTKRTLRHAWNLVSTPSSDMTIIPENQFMGFLSFPYGYGAPLGGPSGRRSSATREQLLTLVILNLQVGLL